MAKSKSNARTTTAVTPGAKPGTKDSKASKAKKEKVEKIQHPLVGSTDPKKYPFTEAPKDWDPAKHKGLRKKDFVEDWHYFGFKEQRFLELAEECKDLAEEAKSGGSRKVASARKQLKTVMERISTIKDKIAARGLDPEELLAQLEAEMEDD